MNEIKSELTAMLEEHIALADAWSNVKRIHTREGKDFKVLSKNFRGCMFKDKDFGLHRLCRDKEIYVVAITKSGKYVSGSMSSTANVDDWGENVQLDRVLQETFVKPYFELNVDEIEKEISKRAEYHRKRIAELSAELEIVDDVAKRYAKAIASAIEEVETAIGRTSANLIINKINSWNYKWMAKED